MTGGFKVSLVLEPAGWSRGRASWICSSLVVACLASSVLGADEEPAAKERAPIMRKAEIYQNTLKGTAFVVLPNGYASAWIVDKAGCLLVTNDHVVRGLEEVKVYFPAHRRGRLMTKKEHYTKKEIPLVGRVVDSYPEKDLAVIRVAALPVGVEQLELAAPEHEIQPGEDAYSVGNPRGLTESMWIFSSGTVRQVMDFEEDTVDLGGGRFKARVVESQAPVNPGDSGGPVVNEHGEVVAVVSWGDRTAKLREVFVHVSEVRDYMDTVRQWLDPETADEYYKRGENYLEKRRFGLALNDFDEAVEIEPKKAEFVEARGEAHWELFRQHNKIDDLSKAAADFSKALNLDPKREKALALRGWCYAAKGEAKSAKKDFDDAIELNDRMGVAYAGLAQLAYDEGDLKKAIDKEGDAIRHDPENATFHEDRGRWNLQLAARLTGENKANSWQPRAESDRALHLARVDFTEAMRLDGLNAERLSWRGIVHVRLGDEAAARADFKRAMEIDPENPLPLNGRAQLNMEKQDFANALADINLAIEKAPGLAILHVVKGNIFYVQGMAEQSKAAWQRAAEIDSDILRKYKFKDLPEFNKKELVVGNNTNETIRVHVQFFTDTTDGKEAWYPSAPGQASSETPMTFEIEPGEVVLPFYTYSETSKVFVRAKKVRIWGEGTTSGRRFDKYKDQDLVLWSGDKYKWHEMRKYFFEFE